MKERATRMVGSATDDQLEVEKPAYDTPCAPKRTGRVALGSLAGNKRGAARAEKLTLD